jgi:hypothetical protein
MEMNRHLIACHPYKAGRHCTYYILLFLALTFSSSIAFTIHCSMTDTTVHVLVAPVAPLASADDSGHDSGAESAAITAILLVTNWASRRPTTIPRRSLDFASVYHSSVRMSKIRLVKQLVAPG